jgi:hypothetical protein
MMTIKEFILAQEKNLGINDWIALIKENGFEKHESSIIQAADSLDLIAIDHDARVSLKGKKHMLSEDEKMFCNFISELIFYAQLGKSRCQRH